MRLSRSSSSFLKMGLSLGFFANFAAPQAMSMNVFESIGKPPAFSLEVSPLKAALGKWSLRSELRVAPGTTIGFGYNRSAHDGERPDFEDWERTYLLEGFWYPYQSGSHALFVGGGFALTDAMRGRRALRSTMTWVRPNSNEIYDTWVNKDRYLSLRESVGYRFLGTRFVTASLRFTFDHLMHTWSESTDKTIRSLNRNTETHGRERFRKHFLLHAGFAFP